MCGIAGLVSTGRVAPERLQEMGAAIVHRGPDDSGTWVDSEAGVGLAHRRLSIVDLSPHGHQPMHSACGRYVLCYNGEVYNHTQIREELNSTGAAPDGGWHGHSDTETLLQAIAHWGLQPTLQKCTGMFAFALWDRRERTLSLVRDRFGEKPLYYGWAGADFIFGSELKALRAHPRFDGEIHRGALQALTERNYIPAPWSIYKRVYKLEPGCILTLTPEAARTPLDHPPVEGEGQNGLRITRYWFYGDVVRRGLEDPIGDRQEALDELERVLGCAIQDQSVADVPVGAFLSGGIDSSTVVALYQKHASTPVRTFSIGFEESGFNEADDARAVAAHLSTVHNEHMVTVKEARDVIPLLPSIYDEPFADSSQIPTFLVSRFARQQVTVALTGDGGDELFAGYNRHFLMPRLWQRAQLLPQSLRSVMGSALAAVPSEAWQGAANLLPGRRNPHFGGKLQKTLQTVGRARRFEDIYNGFLDEWSGEPSPVLGAAQLMRGFDKFPNDSSPDTLRMMACDAVTYLPDDILCKVDRASMAVSLETRVPFLDHRVAEVAARIPLEMKVKGRSGKHILKELLYRHAPRELFQRPKVGFAVPVGEWIKGPLRDWAESLLDPARLRSEGYFDSAVIQRRWQDHLSGRRNSTAAIWAILMFQAWLDQQSVSARAEAA